MKLGWTAYEVNGVEIYKLQNRQPVVVTELTELNPLVTQDEVAIPAFFTQGFHIATVIDISDREATASNEDYIFPLKFEEGRGWICEGFVNKQTVSQIIFAALHKQTVLSLPEPMPVQTE